MKCLILFQNLKKCYFFPQEDEIEASVRDVSKMLGEPLPTTSDGAVPKQYPAKPFQEKSVLSVDVRHLNPDNEMKKLFGAKVIQNEQM